MMKKTIMAKENNMKKITILVPAYNEEESLPFLYERVSKIMNEMENYEFELLFVNDGSKDNTLKEIKELRSKDNRGAKRKRFKNKLC